MLATWEGGEDPPLPEWFRRSILDYDHLAWLAARYGGFAWPEIVVSAITAPTLVIVGGREDPRGEARAWAAQLPDGRAITIADRTHCGTFLAATQCLAAAREGCQVRVTGCDQAGRFLAGCRSWWFARWRS